MKEKPNVTILMPVYNARQWIELALQSVFCQSFADWELDIVDDASTDGSWEYVQRLRDSRVRVFRNSRNLGHPGTINRLIDNARGRYFARMDADDMIFPERLQKQVDALEANPAIDTLGCGTIQTDLDLNPILVRRPVTEDHQIKCTPTLRYPMTYGSLVGKREWWQKWHVDAHATYSTSFDLFLRSFRESVFGNVSEPLYVYRFVGHTRNLRKQTKCIWDRTKSLLRHGWHPGIRWKTVVGLATLAPRPAIYAIKNLIGSYTSVIAAEGENYVTEEDKIHFEKKLAEVRQTPLPLAEI